MTMTDIYVPGPCLNTFHELTHFFFLKIQLTKRIKVHTLLNMLLEPSSRIDVDSALSPQTSPKYFHFSSSTLLPSVPPVA